MEGTAEKLMITRLELFFKKIKLRLLLVNLSSFLSSILNILF